MAAIVGLAGKAGVGKDTVGDWFQSRRQAARYSFASPLKAGICEMFSLPPNVFVDRRLKEMSLAGIEKSPRELAQLLGTEWGRGLIHPDVWVIAAERALRAAELWKTNRLVVVTDARFENEAAWIRKHGTLVHVLRGAAPTSVGVRGHLSEAGIVQLPDDITLHNDETIDDLYLKLEQMFPVGMEQSVN